MKIEVAKPDLEAALQVVSIGTGSTGSDLTTHFVFRHLEDSNQVEVLSNNNRIGASIPIQGCKVELSEDTNAFTVESWRLNKWISAVEDAVLTLEASEGTVKATSPKGSVKFQSLDPEQFAFWDKTYGEAGKSVTVGAKRFQAALGHVKLFISDKDTTTPKLAVTEIPEGDDSLQATDKGALAVVTIADLKTSNLRIHGKDLAQVLTFLGLSGDENIEIKEHDRCLFLVRHDGGVMSVGRPPHAFPEINMDKREGDPHHWVLRKDEVVSAINALSASASKEDTRVTFNVKDAMVSLTMASASGDKVTLHLEAQETGSEEDAAPIPEQGFDIAYPYLLKLLGQWKGDTVKFGINAIIKDGKVKGGWVRFREDRDGDDYLTLLVWLV
jgi:DNA polymerase III sliding clamp (beta) subunit (PCNA family)